MEPCDKCRGSVSSHWGLEKEEKFHWGVVIQAKVHSYDTLSQSKVFVNVSVQQIPFTLFPLLPNGQRITATQLNGRSSFTIPATRLSPAYQVNPQNPTVSPAVQNGFQVGDAFGELNNRVVTGDYFERSLQLGNLSDRSTAVQTTTGAVTTVADLPEDLQAILNALNVETLEDIKSADTTRLRNVGLGLEYQTDGNGNIINVRVVNEQIKQTGRIPTTADNFALFNSADITTGATFTLTDLTAGNRANGANANNPAAQIANQNPQNIGGALLGGGPNPFGPNNGLQNGPNVLRQLFGALYRSPEAFRAPVLDGGEAITKQGSNPFFDRLQAVQNPVDRGTQIAGNQSTLTAEAAQQLASNRAKLDVQVGTSFQQDLGRLAASYYEQYRPVENPFAMARAVDGFIPMAPHLPNGSVITGETTQGQHSSIAEDLAKAMSGTDVGSKKASGGYIYFNFSGGGDGNSTGGNFFGSSGNQQFSQSGGQGSGQQPGPWQYQQQQMMWVA